MTVRGPMTSVRTVLGGASPQVRHLLAEPLQESRQTDLVDHQRPWPKTVAVNSRRRCASSK